MATTIHSLAFSKNTNQIVATYGTRFCTIDAKTGKVSHPESSSTEKPAQPIRDIAIKNDTLAIVYNDKLVSVWSLSDLKLQNQCTSIKRSNAVEVASHGGKEVILLGDKFGDVYGIKFEKEKEQQDIRLLSGHVSMILDMVMSHCGSFLVTAERDEKIRVSRFPQAYCIETFCLGHQEYVSCVHIPVGHTERLISGGGDECLFLWDYKNGKPIQKYSLPEFEQSKSSDSEQGVAIYSSVLAIDSSPVSNEIAVVIERRPYVLLMELDENGDKLSLKKKIPVGRDALCACFDGSGNLWISYGPTKFSQDVTTNSVDILRCGADSVNSKDELVTELNAVDCTPEEKSVEAIDFYEVGKLGKEVIRQKSQRTERAEQNVENIESSENAAKKAKVSVAE